MNSSTDHDLLIELRTVMTSMVNEFKQMREGTNKRIEALELKVEGLEKKDIMLSNDIKQNDRNSSDRYQGNVQRLADIERKLDDKNIKVETNRTYITRKLLEYAIPFICIIIGLVLAKLGILNLSNK